MSDKTSVEVALRIRPLVDREITNGCRNVIEVYNEHNQVKVKKSAFSYNYVFDCDTSQEYFYKTCIYPIIPNLFEGYNVTILAYGQTGSGKTHSMGTNYNGIGEMGVIPRAMQDIFYHIDNDNSNKYNVTVSFIELYQEVLYDLLADKSREECILDIREDNKGIQIPGLTQISVKSAIESLSQLLKGSEKRAVGSTKMNKQSSRSHAIFTVNIIIEEEDKDMSRKCSKFHLVDLAGSERSKKTGATGKTFKEGVNINKGLLALGNVISALGDETSNQGYIGYRDSNLTRLLKDSLGGNSITLMVACVSPADYNLEETISTLRYADRARKIKNKPIVNEDPKAAEINKLKDIISELRLELAGKGTNYVQRNTKEIELEEKCNNLILQLSSALTDKAILHEKLINVQTSNDNGLNILEGISNRINKSSNDGIWDYNDFKSEFQKLESCLKSCTDLAVNNDEMFSTTDLLTENLIKEKQESHTSNQVALNAELEKVSKMILMKEILAKQLANNLIEADEVAEYKEKIIKLEEEKLLLLSKTKSSKRAKTNVPDERKQEIQDLERKIEDLKKKVLEQEKLIKLKKKDEDKINVLHKDIILLKQTKVKLVKSMREESERFRKWKIEKDRELTKLKVQNTKKQTEMIKMERLHLRQQNVLRRKVEEAVAVNKRLKDTLALRKLVRDKNVSSVKKIGQWVQEEIELFINIIDARSSLEVLIEDRKLLHEELDILRNNPQENSAEIRQLENEIEIRSTQISDFQTKILDSDEENKSQNRCDHIQSMADAKQAIQILFDKIGEVRKQGCLSELKNNELKATITEHNKKVESLIKQLTEQEAFFKRELNDIEHSYAEKITILLNQIHRKDIENGITGEASSTCTVQLQLIEHLQAINNEQSESLEKLNEKINFLEKENANLTDRIDNINNLISDEKVKERRPISYKLRGYFDDLSDDDNDDKTIDPDWRKTPLAKRLKHIKKENESIKRNAHDGCTCKRNCCSTKSCRCRKLATPCTPACKCSLDVCLNRGSSIQENSDTSSQMEDSGNKLKVDHMFKEDSFTTPKRKLTTTFPTIH